MADDLPDLPDFDRLQDTPLPPLASPELVRARGVQRRTRSRVLLAGSVLGVMVLGFGSTVALTGGGERSTLTPAAEVATSSDPSPSGTPSPTASSKSPAPSASASPSTSPSPPAPSPSASTASAGGPIPAEVLLVPADLGSSSWVRTTSSRGPADSSLDPCKTGVPDAGSIVAHLSGEYSLVDADGPVPESPYFAQQVVRYPSAAAARAAADAVRSSVGRCPTTKDEGGSSRTWKGVGAAPFLVEVDYLQEGEQVNANWYDYAGVTVAGDLVSTWILGDPHGMNRASADKAAAAAVSRLCKVSGPC